MTWWPRLRRAPTTCEALAIDTSRSMLSPPNNTAIFNADLLPLTYARELYSNVSDRFRDGLLVLAGIYSCPRNRFSGRRHALDSAPDARFSCGRRARQRLRKRLLRKSRTDYVHAGGPPLRRR